MNKKIVFTGIVTASVFFVALAVKAQTPVTPSAEVLTIQAAQFSHWEVVCSLQPLCWPPSTNSSGGDSYQEFHFATTSSSGIRSTYIYQPDPNKNPLNNEGSESYNINTQASVDSYGIESTRVYYIKNPNNSSTPGYKYDKLFYAAKNLRQGIIIPPDVHYVGQEAIQRLGNPPLPAAPVSLNSKGEKSVEAWFGGNKDSSGTKKTYNLDLRSVLYLILKGDADGVYEVTLQSGPSQKWSIEPLWNTYENFPLKGDPIACKSTTIMGHPLDSNCQVQLSISVGATEITPAAKGISEFSYMKPTIVSIVKVINKPFFRTVPPGSPPRTSPPGKFINLNGARFTPTGNVVTFRDQNGTAVTQTVPSTNNGASLVFTVPNLPDGDYYMQISNTLGSSNEDNFTISRPSVTVIPRIDGVEVLPNRNEKCLSTVMTPFGPSAGNCMRTVKTVLDTTSCQTTQSAVMLGLKSPTCQPSLKPLISGTYSVAWNSGVPYGANDAIPPVVTSSKILSDNQPYLVFYLDFKSPPPTPIAGATTVPVVPSDPLNVTSTVLDSTVLNIFNNLSQWLRIYSRIPMFIY